ncbi:MAG: BtpA/SgcQ family protein [Armatimonadetes bacterium]|nr:BtpA/SgcQ family protein [Armatimonadota bacterium]
MTFRELFGGMQPVGGVGALGGLPGSRGYSTDLGAVRRRAVDEARVLADGGCDAVLVENSGDAPFTRDQVGPEIVAAMTWLVSAVVDAVVVPVGVSVLRNDAVAAVAVASVAEARFVRVPVHVGVMVTEQGLVEGRAPETLRFRTAIGSDVAVFADVHVRHANPMGDDELKQTASDAYFRGLANALVVTCEPNQACDLRQARILRRAIPDAPLLAGSGVHAGNARELLDVYDGLVVGDAFHESGDPARPLERERVRGLVNAAHQGG